MTKSSKVQGVKWTWNQYAAVRYAVDMDGSHQGLFLLNNCPTEPNGQNGRGLCREEHLANCNAWRWLHYALGLCGSWGHRKYCASGWFWGMLWIIVLLEYPTSLQLQCLDWPSYIAQYSLCSSCHITLPWITSSPPGSPVCSLVLPVSPGSPAPDCVPQFSCLLRQQELRSPGSVNLQTVYCKYLIQVNLIKSL